MTTFHSRKQTIVHNPPETYGDCYRTCLAMVTGLEPTEVPHFYDKNEYPDATAANLEIRAFLRDLGYTVASIPFRADTIDPIIQQLDMTSYDVPVIVMGKSTIGEWNHVVIRYKGETHDPSYADGSMTEPSVDEGYGRFFWIEILSPVME